MKQWVSGACALVCICWAANAPAQGQVTLGGNVDIGVRVDSNKTSVRQVSSNSLLPSRLTFGALEDLGDGWRAQAVLEAGLTVDDGAGAAQPPGVPAGSFTFGRFAAVAVGSEQTGYVSMGRQYTPLFALGGSNVADVFGGSALGSTNTVSSYTVRASNSIAYSYGYGPRTLLRGSPPVGLGAAFMLASGESPAGSRAGSQFGFNLSYGARGWWVGYGFHQIWGSSAAINPAVPDSGSPILRQQTLAASYDFGSVRVNAGVNRGSNGLNTASGVNRVGWYVGTTYAFSGNQEFKALYGRLDDRRPMNADVKTLQLGYTYALSRRTQLYALAGEISNSANAAAIFLNTSPVMTTAPGRNSRVVATGVLHRF